VIIAFAALMIGVPATAAVSAWLGFPGFRIVLNYPSAATATPGDPYFAISLPDIPRSVVRDMDEAQRSLGFLVRAPNLAVVGSPRRVTVSPLVPDGVLLASYEVASEAGRPSEGLDLIEFKGAIDNDLLFDKLVGPPANFARLDVRGLPGYFIASPHDLVVRDRTRRMVYDLLVAGRNVLIWQEDGVIIRLESDLDRAALLEIARSMQ
jgi:hypothetical protein